MSKCKGCGAEIIWARNEKGTMISLDHKAPVYLIKYTDGHQDTRCLRVGIDDLPACYVAHFATCPKANE